MSLKAVKIEIESPFPIPGRRRIWRDIDPSIHLSDSERIFSRPPLHCQTEFTKLPGRTPDIGKALKLQRRLARHRRRHRMPEEA